MSGRPISRRPIFGTLSLVALCGAVFVGIFTTRSLAANGGAAAFGAIAGIGFGFIASVISPILGGVSIARKEKPEWPALLGFGLGIFPAAVGVWLLWGLLKMWYVG